MGRLYDASEEEGSRKQLAPECDFTGSLKRQPHRHATGLAVGLQFKGDGRPAEPASEVILCPPELAAHAGTDAAPGTRRLRTLIDRKSVV